MGGEELGGALEGVFAERGIVEEAVVLVGGEVVFGGVFEINSRSWKKGLRDAYPQRDIIQVKETSKE